MKTLKEVRARIKELAVKAELTDEESEELKDLMEQEPKLALKAEAVAKAEKLEAEEKAAQEKAEKERIDAEVEKQVAAKLAEANRLPMGGYTGAPHQSQFAQTRAYDGLSAGDLGLAIKLQQDFSRSGKMPAPSQAAYKALAIKMIEDKQGEKADDVQLAGYYSEAMKVAGLPFDKDAYKDNGDALKAASDPMYTGGTTDGGNWVHTAYSRDLWMAIRAQTEIVSMIPKQVIPDGFSSSTIAIEGTDFTWYSAPEASSTDATLKKPAPTISGTQITTPTNREITVGKMGATGWYTGELTEDSIIRFVPQARAQLEVSGKEQLEHLVIDGDTAATASTNINDIGGTPSTSGTTRDLFVLFNGFRKLALVTNTANSRSGGTLDEDDYLETMWLMGTAGLGGADLTKCSFIVDPNVYKKSLQMASVKTKDVWANATLQNGVLTGLWGYKLYPSWFMHFKSAARKANTAGKVDQDTTTNNTTGSILAVRWDQWKFAYKRMMTIETVRVADADAYQLVAWMRVGMNYRDTEAAAITYNLTV